MYNEARMIGVAVGIAVGLLIVAFVLRFINRNKAMATEYDEMQKQIRGVGYRYAFFTVMIFEAFLCILTLGMELPAEPYVIHFAAIFIGVTVQAAYCIWNDAYVGLNTNLGRYIVIMTIVSLFNLGVAFMSWRQGELVIGGKLQAQSINLLCGLMFAVLGVVGLIKKRRVKNRSDEPIFHSQGLSRSASNLAGSHRRIRLREILLAVSAPSASTWR